MAMAKFLVSVNGSTLAQGDVIKINGIDYIFKGCKDGRNVRMVLKKNPMKWFSLDSHAYNNIKIQEVSMAKKQQVTVAKIATKAAPKQVTKKHREGYKKDCLSRVNSEGIKALCKDDYVCNYLQNWCHVRMLDDKTLEQYGVTRSGKKVARKYEFKSVEHIGKVVVFHVINSSGDKVEIAHDKESRETLLIVRELHKIKSEKSDKDTF